MAIENEKFAGLTDAQVERILEQVATVLNLACDICKNEAERHSGHESAYTFHALDYILSGVGALADMPIRGGVVGDFGAWMMGPYFSEYGDSRNTVAGGKS